MRSLEDRLMRRFLFRDGRPLPIFSRLMENFDSDGPASKISRGKKFAFEGALFKNHKLAKIFMNSCDSYNKCSKFSHC